MKTSEIGIFSNYYFTKAMNQIYWKDYREIGIKGSNLINPLCGLSLSNINELSLRENFYRNIYIYIYSNIYIYIYICTYENFNMDNEKSSINRKKRPVERQYLV